MTGTKNKEAIMYLLDLILLWFIFLLRVLGWTVAVGDVETAVPSLSLVEPVEATDFATFDLDLPRLSNDNECMEEREEVQEGVEGHGTNDIRDEGCIHPSFSNITSTFQDCNWKKKLCGPNAYDIRIVYKSIQHQKRVPLELERSVAMAVDFWSRSIRNRPNPHPQRTRISKKLKRECGTIFPNELMGNQTMIQLNFDLMLYIKLEKLPVATLGEAGVLLEDPNDRLPRIASIALSADLLSPLKDQHDGTSCFPSLNQCDWANVIAHEIGHALGFGKRLVLQSNLIDRHRKKYHFCGGNATKEWRRFSGCRKSFPPIDESGSHWPERDCIRLELMTPLLDFISTDGNGRSNGRLPISRLSLAAMNDIGYEVNYDCAETNEQMITTRQCKCQREQYDSLVCHPYRAAVIKRRYQLWLFRRNILRVGKQLLVAGFRGLRKGYLLKPWWWRRKYRRFRNNFEQFKRAFSMPIIRLFEAVNQGIPKMARNAYPRNFQRQSLEVLRHNACRKHQN
ncbi:hypothetical protein IV203_019478 [Nitzschia inconspicua]|uniref:Leishmanolysin-like peptidase n=1 Tax=Nitzschia inconspicua TaxID=303405 RepID=A0A9K3LZJ4_9STRA|nr:hypothetical protein IV203_019478 [Nitzschia inconspicua]